MKKQLSFEQSKRISYFTIFYLVVVGLLWVTNLFWIEIPSNMRTINEQKFVLWSDSLFFIMTLTFILSIIAFVKKERKIILILGCAGVLFSLYLFLVPILNFMTN